MCPWLHGTYLISSTTIYSHLRVHHTGGVKRLTHYPSFPMVRLRLFKILARCGPRHAVPPCE